MTDFDTQWYLRRSAEDRLISRQDPPVVDAAHALLALDLVSFDDASAILADYARAESVRGMHQPHFGRPPAPSSTVPAAQRRVHVDRTLERTWGSATVRTVTLSPGRVVVAVLLRMNPQALPSGGRRRHHTRPNPPSTLLQDDCGNQATAGFGGGGSDDEWRGRYEGVGDFATNTGWLEIFDERIELHDQATSASVRLQTFDGADLADRAARYLDRCLEEPNSDVDVQAAIAAFVACGALGADSLVITRALQVRDLLESGRRPGKTDDVGARWQALLSGSGSGSGGGRRRRGVPRTVFVNVDVPTFDGVTISVIDLESHADSFTVDVEIVGAFHSSHDQLSLGVPLLTFRAFDDRGHGFRGSMDDWSSDDRQIYGRIGVDGPLDPQATTLDLVFATERSEAVVTVPLTPVPRNPAPLNPVLRDAAAPVQRGAS